MPVTTEEVRAELGRSLGRAITRLERRSSEYRTSFAVEELDVWTDDGEPLRLVLKDVSPDGLSENARAAKPDFLFDPMREIETYRTVLASLELGTARCVVAHADPDHSSYWLVIERVDGVELFQVGDFAIWEEAARWLAAMHARDREVGAPGLLRYGRTHYERWLPRAREYTGAPELDRLAAGYDAVVERLLALPASFVHGELYASNVLVCGRLPNLRVCPVDWEMAAIGPGLVDLAALSTGNWDEDERHALANAYFEAAARPEPREALDEGLECCRLHLAVQWLGWSPDWTPPAEHAQDWLSEALRAAEKLGIRC